MRSLAGIWRALVLLMVLVGAGVGSVLVLGARVEAARTQNNLLSSLRIDAQQLHVTALTVSLDARIGPSRRRDIRSSRQGMLESLQALHGASNRDLRLLRAQEDLFSAAVARELSSIRAHRARRVDPAALEVASQFKKLDRSIVRLENNADHRYDVARREEEGAVLAFFALALISSLAFAWRARNARRDRAVLLRRENDRLRELDRMKEEFVASVSHELRTPLTSIRGYLELVLEGDAGELTPAQNDYLRIIDRNTDRLLDLINDLLDLAQAESGRLVLNLEPVSLASVVTDAVDGMRPAADARQIGLGLQVADENGIRISLDRKRIGQVVDNLLSNAVKFTPAGGNVEVRLRTDNGDLRVDVSDTGIGIPEAEQAQLFERFFRTEAASGQAIQGTGLGLAISKSIVEAHGGRIEVASAVGEGTTFSVLLPRAADAIAS